MKFKKLICAILSFVCMLCLGLGIGLQTTNVAKAETPTVELTNVDTEYNNTVWGGATMAVGLIFNKNFTAKAYDGNGGYDAPIIADVKNYTKINGQSGAVHTTFLTEENGTRIVLLYDNSSLTVPEGQEYTTFTIEAGAPFGGEYLPEITLYLVEGKWQATDPADMPDPVVESVTVTNIHNRKGEAEGQRLLIFISDSDYANANADISAKIANTNVLDYVNVYTSATEYKTLKEIYQGNAQAKIWGEVNSVGFQVDANYHGAAVYAVEIKAGAQFPALTNNYTTYEVSADITYYNVNYNSTDTSINDFSVTWTTENPAGPETPVEPPVEPTLPELGTPDVTFVELHSANNNSVWDGTTRAVRLVFSENFTAKAYDANDGGFDAAVIADVRHFVKINGQVLGNLTFLQIENENSITFLYDESLLAIPEGQEYTTFTIEAGAPFGGRYLPAVTLYFNGETWQTEAVDLETNLLGIVATQNNSTWDETQNSVRLRFNYAFNNTENYNINDADGLNMLSKLTFNGTPLTAEDILIFTEDIGGNTITILYKASLLDMEKEEGARYHTLALTESVNYLGVEIPAFTLYLRNNTWITEMLPAVEVEDVETAVGYNTANIIHIRDWNLDGDETTAVNNMILFFFPNVGFPAEHNLFLNLDKVAEYNVFEKIKLHMITPNDAADENGFVTLGQVFNAGGWVPSSLSDDKDKIVVVNMWETVNSVAFSMGAEYTAESFDYVIVEEGCEFPNYYYTNKLDTLDYVQNGESVDYEGLAKASFWQTQTVKIYTNPADFQGPSINTNWGIDTNMGEITVSGADYADGYVIIQLENSNYPTAADGDNLNQNISAGNAAMALNMLADIYVNGISLYDRVVHYGANGITSYYNYNGYGNFAISVVLADGETVTEIIVGKDLRVPLYGMSDIAASAYGIMYKETAETVSFTKGEQGFVQDKEILWTVIFDDGENVKIVKVAHGAMLAASDIPETPVKAGYEFVAWVYGIDGLYTFEPTSNIATCYYLTVRWKEADNTTSDDDGEKKSGCSGCGSVSGSLGAVVSLLVVAGIRLLKKKED